MIVSAYAFLFIDKDLAVTEFASGFPDDVLQPSRTQRVAPQFEILVSHHIQQNQRARIFKLISFAQSRNVLAASVCIIRTIFVLAVVPVFTKRFFAIKENEPVSHLWLLLSTGKHSSNLEQSCNRRCGIVCA